MVIKILEESSLKSCIIFGAGSAIAKNFMQNYQDHLEIHAFARKIDKTFNNVKSYATNYEDLDQFSELINKVEYIIFCIGVTNASDQTIKDVNIGIFDKIFAKITNKKKVVFISSAAILFNKGAYVESKLHGEQYLEKSLHDYISLRPSVMHGPFDKNNIINMQNFIKKMPFIPVIAPNYVIQPVYMPDIASVIYKAIENDKFTNKNYTISGPNQIKLYKVFKLLKHKLKSTKLLIPIPLKPVQIVVKILSYVLPKDKIMAHQILNMKIHSPFDSSELKNDYDYQPQSFEETLFNY